MWPEYAVALLSSPLFYTESVIPTGSMKFEKGNVDVVVAL